ncbi:conserved hypothetical protein [Neospora caninum Liverpool]|uniref:Uncharacterized protein n=1 Tax=Neospora caninum (strain Liverpool) TaxID=572307 RepID=F0VP90_NEOCL|nr:conserved hypothetical protein [Neospora caninum Liverpool]CBZ55536.1 conserved hypothetical protein [Neospora caninum Liverpool]CEL70276.1 TPA: hypothetical protein BN1204_059610 [Neospora caninum Liverpool]|eukprot:XP_003885564.1 conserved hypothetical protein [Neospora caninum Liverpool]
MEAFKRLSGRRFPADHGACPPCRSSSGSFATLSSSRFSWSPLGVAVSRSPALCAAAQQAGSETPEHGVASPAVASGHSSVSAPPRVPSSAGAGVSGNAAQFSSRFCTELVIDAAAAGLASFGVSPFVTIIDRSIVRNAAGVQTLWSSIAAGCRDLVFRPRHLLAGRDFRIVFGVYAGTYFVANGAVTVGQQFRLSEGTAELVKFLGTTAANMFLCIRKDIIFAKLFGTPSGVAGGVAVAEAAGKATSRRFPLVSTLLFVCRDSLTIAASFNAPPYLAAWLTRRAARDDAGRRAGPQPLGANQMAERREAAHAGGRIPTLPQAHRDWAGSDQDDPAAAGGGESVGAALEEKRVWRRFTHKLATEKAFADSTAQLLCPVAVQFLSTPLHLLALDVYNRPGHSSAQRTSFLVGAYAGTVAARASRILPAFGIGGILNAKTKGLLRKYAGDAQTE